MCAASADPYEGYVIYYDGAWQSIGGTSGAAPTWAALAALTNASVGCDGTPIGWANPLLYKAAANAYASDFNDVKATGDNSIVSGQPLYPVGSAYDMATGLGTPIGTPLAQTLCNGGTPPPAATSIGTVAMPDTLSMPTGVTVDTTDHIAYIAESDENAVAKITGTSGSSFSGTATDIANTSLCASGCALPGLDFPDDLALSGSEQLFAADFCVGTQTGVCSGEAAGTTTAASQQTATASGQMDTLSGCGYPAGLADFTATTANRLFVACAGSGVVAECSPGGGGTPACGSAATTVPVTKPNGSTTQPVPSGVATIPTTTTTPAVVVADAANSTVSVVSYNGSSLAASSPVSLVSGCDPANVAVGPSVSGTSAVYVACPGNGTIEVGTVSGTGTPALGSFAATSLPTTGSNTPSPYGVAVSAAGTLLAVTDSANNDVVMYPTLSGTTLGSDAVVAVGTTPDGVGIDGGNAFVANESSDNVTVVDPPAKRVRGHVVRTDVDAHARLRVSLSPLVAPVTADAR